MTRNTLVAASWVAGLAALVTACLVTPSPSNAPTAAPTASTTAYESPWTMPSHRLFATARPFEPAPPVEQIADLPTVDPSRTSATVTRAGVRLTLEVETTTIEAGSQVWVDGTLENVGRRTLRWAPKAVAFPSTSGLSCRSPGSTASSSPRPLSSSTGSWRRPSNASSSQSDLTSQRSR